MSLGLTEVQKHQWGNPAAERTIPLDPETRSRVADVSKDHWHSLLGEPSDSPFSNETNRRKEELQVIHSFLNEAQKDAEADFGRIRQQLETKLRELTDGLSEEQRLQASWSCLLAEIVPITLAVSLPNCDNRFFSRQLVNGGGTRAQQQFYRENGAFVAIAANREYHYRLQEYVREMFREHFSQAPGTARFFLDQLHRIRVAPASDCLKVFLVPLPHARANYYATQELPEIDTAYQEGPIVRAELYRLLEEGAESPLLTWVRRFLSQLPVAYGRFSNETEAGFYRYSLGSVTVSQKRVIFSLSPHLVRDPDDSAALAEKYALPHTALEAELLERQSAPGLVWLVTPEANPELLPRPDADIVLDGTFLRIAQSN